MAMPPEKFRDLFSSLTAGTAEDAQGILDCAEVLELTAEQRADVHALKLAHQKAAKAREAKSRKGRK